MGDAAQRSWTIRDYREGDEAAIVALFEKVFGKPMGRTRSAPHWRWEYTQNPVGPRTIELVWDGATLAGQYAVSPRRVWCGGREVLAALSLDTMTHPDYARQGIFTASADACYEAMAERGFAFVYGFPKASSVGAFERRLSWSLVMKMPVHVKPIDVGRFVAEKVDRPRLAPWLSLGSRMLSRAPGIVANTRRRWQSRVPVEVTACSAIEEWADDLWARCRAHHHVWVVRDRAYLDWRYDARPESDYVFLRAEAGGTIVGLAVLAVATREQGRICFVMELLADPTLSAALPTLLAAIEAQARAQSCAFVSAIVPPGSRYRGAFLAHAYLPLPERLFPQELHFGVRRTSDEVIPELLDARAWHLTWGDTNAL
jgi:hypothetical protein